MEDKERLLGYIGQSFSVIADTNTYVWIRAHSPEILAQNPELGGGNFLMVLGLFAVVNYLAKIYAVLKDKNAAITVKQAETARHHIKDCLRDHPQLRGLIEPKRAGQINERDAFVQLIADCPGLSFGLTTVELIDVWDNLRNKLTHTITPGFRYTVDVRMGGKTFEKAKSGAHSFKKVFFKMPDGHMHCFADVLILEIEKIKEWLTDGVAKDLYHEENMRAVISWLEENQTK